MKKMKQTTLSTQSSSKLNVQNKNSRKINISRGNTSLINTRRFGAPIRRDSNTVRASASASNQISKTSIEARPKVIPQPKIKTSSLMPPPLETYNLKSQQPSSKKKETWQRKKTHSFPSKKSTEEKKISNVQKDSIRKKKPLPIPNTKPQQKKSFISQQKSSSVLKKKPLPANKKLRQQKSFTSQKNSVLKKKTLPPSNKKLQKTFTSMAKLKKKPSLTVSVLTSWPTSWSTSCSGRRTDRSSSIIPPYWCTHPTSGFLVARRRMLCPIINKRAAPSAFPRWSSTWTRMSVC